MSPIERTAMSPAARPQPDAGPWRLTLAALCIIPRLALWFAYEPSLFPDTKDYLSLAQRLSTARLADYNGERTPVYPLLLLVAGQAPRLVWLLQALLGVAAALLLFELMLRCTRSRLAAYLAGLACGWSLNLMLFETCVLTESLATTLLVVTVFLYWQLRAEPRTGALSYAILGTVLSLAGLTRPLLLIAIPLCLLFLLISWGRPIPPRGRATICFSVPVILLVGGWCAVVWRATGSFTPTTLIGYNLTQHSGGFIELAPDDWAQLRDIYLHKRVEHVAETGTYSGTIWQAEDEMLQATGLSESALSARLRRMSIALFVAHPDLYLASVSRSWLDFWAPKTAWRPEVFRYPRIVPLVQATWHAQAVLLTGAKIVLLPAALLWYVACAVWRPWRPAAELPLFVLAIVGSASVVQALVEYGSNARYAIPFQPLIIFVVILWGWDVARVVGRRWRYSPQR